MTRRHLILAAGVFAAFALGQSVADHALSASPIVVSLVQGKDGKLQAVARAGGFFLDPRHVVTNLNDCCSRTKDGQNTVPGVFHGDDAVVGKVVWNSEDINTAILEIDDPLKQAPGTVTVAPLKLVLKDAAVFTVQYDKDSKPGIMQGQLLEAQKTEDGTIVLVTTAGMNPGNAGSALFNACGQVIGVNAFYDEEKKRQVAIAIDQILDGAKSANVQLSVADQPCKESGPSQTKGDGGGGGDGKGDGGGEEEQRPPWRLPEGNEWIPVVFLGALLLLAFRPGTRQKVVRAVTRRRSVPMPAPYAPPAAVPPPTPAPPVARKPALRGVSGQYAGATIALDRGSSTLGRDPRASNLVFGAEAGSVSKRHCTVRWDAERQVFVLEDHGSTNGTFLASGERLPANQPRDLQPGERFYIGDLHNQFEVRME